MEFLGDILDAHVLAGKQNDEVIEHISHFVGELLVGNRTGLADGIDRLITHLLGDALHTVIEECVGGSCQRFLPLSRDSCVNGSRK